MRLGVKYDGVGERIGGALNMIPIPIGLAMFGMPLARSLQVAQDTGMLGELAQAPPTAAELAQNLQLRDPGVRRVLDVLVASGQLELDSSERYSFARRAAKWLDPSSETYVGGFLADTAHYWSWWQGLEELVRDGRSIELHDKPPEDPYWRSYMIGQYQLARLSGAPVAKAVALPDGARSLLDVAGGHGEFSMACCRRQPGLDATIVDLPGSARAGREIVAEAGMSERVHHVEGDMFTTELGGPHAGALVFNIIHHLSPDQVEHLFSRVHDALRPGAPICVLDLYDRPPGRRPDSGSFLGLFFHLTSSADTYSREQVASWIAGAGFGKVAAKTLPQLPGLAILRAERV